MAMIAAAGAIADFVDRGLTIFFAVASAAGLVFSTYLFQVTRGVAAQSGVLHTDKDVTVSRRLPQVLAVSFLVAVTLAGAVLPVDDAVFLPILIVAILLVGLFQFFIARRRG